MQLRLFIHRHFVVTFYGFVYHVSFWRRTEHLVYRQIERTYAVSLLESKAMVAGRFTYYVHRSNLAYMLDSFFLDEKPHAFL